MTAGVDDSTKGLAGTTKNLPLRRVEQRPMTTHPACDACKRGPQQLLIPVTWQGKDQKWCARCVVGGVMV